MRLRGPAVVLLLALLASLAQSGSHEAQAGETFTVPATPQADNGNDLAPLDLLELSTPALRYLRAFTAQCYQPAAEAAISQFDNSWAVALVTIWNDLTAPENGVGRLVTSVQLQMEASLMIQEERHVDALAILELSLLFNMYPFHNRTRLGAWQRALASDENAFALRRMTLAHTLTLLARARAAQAGPARDLDRLEGAMVAGAAAKALLQDSGAEGELEGVAGAGDGSGAGGGGSRAEGVDDAMVGVAEAAAAALQDAKVKELRRLLEGRGLKCKNGCHKRANLLRILVPALRIPLELISSAGEQHARPAAESAQGVPPRNSAGSSAGGGGDGSNGSASARLAAKAKPVPAQASRQRSPPALPPCGPTANGARPAACTSAAAAAAAAAARAAQAGDGSARWPRVVVPADIRMRLAAYPPAAYRSDWERLRTIFADVSASLPQALLEEVGVKCASPTGQQLAWRCREQALMESAGWGVRSSAADAALANMTALEAHISSVEEVLWRLEQVLGHAATGVRMSDGTTWVKQPGWHWRLGRYMSEKLYPGGAGMPVHHMPPRPAEPTAGPALCLDKTFLFDTVVKLNSEGLSGLQYALDNLHYAQFHAGGQEVFWEMLSNDNPLCVLGECADGRSAIGRMLSALYARGGGGGGSSGASGHRPSSSAATGSGVARPHTPHSSDPYPHPQYHRRSEEPPQRPPPLLSYMEFSEQQLQQNLAAATGPSQTDPFVAAFVASCLVGCASLYIYTHRKRLARLLALPGRLAGAGAGARTESSAGGSGGVAAPHLRHAATAALRDAMAVDNATRLAAAIEAAEAAGVQKLLVKKGRAALQALRKRRHQGAGGAARARHGAGAGPAGHGMQAQHSPHTARGVERTSSSSSAGSTSSSALARSLSSSAGKDGGDSADPTPAGLTPLGSSLLSASGSVLGSSSFGGGGSLGRSISEGTASLLRAAEDARAGLLDGAGEGDFLQPNRRGKPALRAVPAPLVPPAPRSAMARPPTAAQQQLSSAGAPPYSHPLRSNGSDLSDDAAVAAALAVSAAEAQAAAAAATGDATPSKRPSSAAGGGRGPFSPATPAESVPRSSPADNHGSDGSSGSPPPSPRPATLAPAPAGPSTAGASPAAAGGGGACHATAAAAVTGKTVVSPPPPPPPRTKATTAVAAATAAAVPPATKRNLALPAAPTPVGGMVRAATPVAKAPAVASAGKPVPKQPAQAKGGAGQVSPTLPTSERRPTVALVPRALLRRNQGQAAARAPSPSPLPSPAEHRQPASAAPPAAVAGSLSPPRRLVSDASSQHSAGSSLPPSPTQLGAAASADDDATCFAPQAGLGSPVGQGAAGGGPSVPAEGAATAGAAPPSLGLGGWSRFAPPALGAWEQQHASPRVDAPGVPGLLGPHFGDIAGGLRPPFPSPTTPFGAAPPHERPASAAGTLAASSEVGGAAAEAAALLAQLHEIWGSGGGGLGDGAAAGGAAPQLYPQLAIQQAAAAQNGYQALGGAASLGGSAASSGDPPLSPSGADAGRSSASATGGLPPASSAMLREVLGSPLAGLPPLAGQHSRQLSAESLLSGSRHVAATLDLLASGPLPLLEPGSGSGLPSLGTPAACATGPGAVAGAEGRRNGLAGAGFQDDSLDLAALGFTEGSSLALLELPPAARGSAELRHR